MTEELKCPCLFNLDSPTPSLLDPIVERCIALGIERGIIKRIEATFVAELSPPIEFLQYKDQTYVVSQDGVFVISGDKLEKIDIEKEGE